MTRVCCNLCGANETSLFLRKGGYTIVSCKRCGLVYVNPRDSVEKMLMTYSRPYFELEKFSDGARIGYRNYAVDRELHIAYFKKKLADILKRKKKGKTPKDHTERFRILKEDFSDLYLLLDKYYPIYRQTYSLIIDKLTCDEVKKNVERIIEEHKISI